MRAFKTNCYGALFAYLQPYSLNILPLLHFFLLSLPQDILFIPLLIVTILKWVLWCVYIVFSVRTNTSSLYSTDGNVNFPKTNDKLARLLVICKGVAQVMKRR